MFIAAMVIIIIVILKKILIVNSIKMNFNFVKQDFIFFKINFNSNSTKMGWMFNQKYLIILALKMISIYFQNYFQM
jgi:hypothetical protein